ncbi:hypothetical protein HYR99_34095 [Candidatus Poribacteria bacterium]|nr:hypothetical protein [Candidatus Poribacteria bacterium]
MIQAYFAQIKVLIDGYAGANFVLDVKLSFESRPGEQGYLTGSMTFVDGSVLHFREFLDTIGENVDKVMYTYHYQNASNQFIFRYDNARHKPPLRSLEHKHLPNQIVETPAPTLKDGYEILFPLSVRLVSRV